MDQKDKQALPQVDPNTIERYNNDAGASSIAIRSLDDIKRISTIFIESGMFKGDKSLNQKQQLYQAGVKIIAGVEFGIQPFAAMRGINIINGNAEMSANLMAAKVKKHPKYDYRVTKWDNGGCTIAFYEILKPGDPRDKWDELGESSFTQEDADRAQLSGGQNWRKFARNMFFARAMSNGVRIYTPDVFYGAPIYVEGEISGEFDQKPAAEQPKAQPEAVEAEIVDHDVQADPDSAVYRDIAEEQAEVEEPDNQEPDGPGEPETSDEKADEDDPELMAKVASDMMGLGLPTRGISKLIRETTKKMTLKNCNHGDLVKLAGEIERIKSGQRTLPEEWFDKGPTQ